MAYRASFQGQTADVQVAAQILDGHCFNGSLDQHEGVIGLGMIHIGRVVAEFCMVSRQERTFIGRAVLRGVGAVTRKPSTAAPAAVTTSGVNNPSDPIRKALSRPVVLRAWLMIYPPASMKIGK